MQLRADVHVQALGSRAAGRSASIASSGGRPNFEPWCAVLTASCVSASMPGVTRIRKRFAPSARARSSSSSESSTISAPASAAPLQQLVLLVVAVDHEPVAGDARAARELELADGRDVGAEPFLGEEPQHRERRERLRAVDDERAGGRRAYARAWARSVASS